MSSSPKPQTPTTSSPWWKRLCRVGWIMLRSFWGTIVLGLALNVLVSLAFLSRGTSLQSLYFWPVLDWMQHNLFSTSLIIFVSIGLTGLTWFGSRQGEMVPREQVQARAPTKHNRTTLLGLLGREYRRQLAQSLQRAVMMELGLQERRDVTSSPAQLVSWRLDTPEERSLLVHTSIVQA